MDILIFRETITLAGLARIAMPIGRVVPFEEGGVDLRTEGRSDQRHPDAVVRAKDGSKIHVNDASRSPRLVHGGIVEIRRGADVGMLRTSRLTGARRKHYRPDESPLPACCTVPRSLYPPSNPFILPFWKVRKASGVFNSLRTRGRNATP